MADENAKGWRPNPGDVLSGRVSDLDKGWSDWSKDFYPIVTIRKEDGEEVRVHCFHAVLANRLAAIRPKIGDRLTLTYEGQKDSKDGKRKISIYKVEAPDRVVDPDTFWQGVGAASPNRSAGPVSTPEPDVPIPDVQDEIPF